jgi:hypothetical protein
MAETSSKPSSDSHVPIAEIDLGPSKVDQFLDNHQNKLVIAAILIALGVVAYVIYDGLAQAKANEAGAALLSAQESGEYENVITTWPDTNAAASAKLLLADVQWADSQPDSIATLEEFINQYPQHPSIATAKTSLGLRLIEQGKTDEARDVLAEVVDNDAYRYIAPMACIALGDIAKAEGKISDATQWYERAQQDSEGQKNAFEPLASARLLIVNAEPPTKLKPQLPAPKEEQQQLPSQPENTGDQPAEAAPAAAPEASATPAPEAADSEPEDSAPEKSE